jgi:hypothetical protein
LEVEDVCGEVSISGVKRFEALICRTEAVAASLQICSYAQNQFNSGLSDRVPDRYIFRVYIHSCTGMQ